MRILLSFLLLPFFACSAETPDNVAVIPDPLDKPPTVAPVVLVGEGGIQKTEGSIRAWRPETPTALSGRYRLLGITDGHGWLDLKVTKTKSEDEPWRVEAKLVTEWTKDEWTTLSFQGASLEGDAKNPLPYFEVSRRHFVGFFVEFTDRSDEKARPAEKAIIIGPDVFVRDDNYKPRSYRGDAATKK
jgi:hypothetical protein